MCAGGAERANPAPALCPGIASMDSLRLRSAERARGAQHAGLAKVTTLSATVQVPLQVGGLRAPVRAVLEAAVHRASFA